MEQEPVYVPSGKVVLVCEDLLGRIYDRRQTDREAYVQDRMNAHNAQVQERNKRRRFLRWFGCKPELYVTPAGMEAMIAAEVKVLPDEVALQHPMIQIHRQYGQLEHEAKDAMIMARWADTVPISADFARGLSHMGIDTCALRRPTFGFIPSTPTKSC